MMFRDDPDLLPTLVIMAAIAALVLISTSGCQPIAYHIDGLRDYCDSLSSTKVEYQQCMERETRFLKPDTGAR